MSRFPHYLGIAVVVIVGSAMAIMANRFAPISRIAPAMKTSSATPSSLFVSSGSASRATSTATTTTTEATLVKASKPKVPPPTTSQKTTETKSTGLLVSTSTQVAAPAPLPSSVSFSLDTVSTTLRNALVNIICYAPAGSGVHSISGSGIFIDTKGIILTNAHVAQYFLLADRGVSCTIRSGSPASNAYEAALLYISPSWIHTNATIITQVLPSGTGEYDFALLAVTKSDTGEPLPPSFPFLPLAYDAPSASTPVVIASYGAQFLDPSQIQSSLYPTIVFGSIKNVFTFASTSIDVLSLGGTVAAQEGSSGGGVADSSGALIGTITTSTVQGATDTRILSAITASYIRSAYAREMGSSLDLLLNESIASALTEFSTKIPGLESIITAHL